MFRLSTLLLLISGSLTVPAAAGLIGGNFEISGPHCRFPDVAYAGKERKYLVVWVDYGNSQVFGRFVSKGGSVSGLVFAISRGSDVALYPAISYDEINNEFLVAWDDEGRGSSIYGQRIRASDGGLVGSNFGIGTMAGGIRSAVAWRSVTQCFLVVYFVPGATGEIYGQRLSGSGELLGKNFQISRDEVFSGYPAAAWASSGDRFLVTWDNDQQFSLWHAWSPGFSRPRHKDRLKPGLQTGRRGPEAQNENY